MRFHPNSMLLASALAAVAACSAGISPNASAQPPPGGKSPAATPSGGLTLHPRLGLLAPGDSRTSYSPVVINEPFSMIMAKLSADKPAVMRRQLDLLAARYDLANRPAKGVTMSRGKPIQQGVRVKLQGGATWASLADMSPEEIRDKGLFPLGFLPLPHVKQQEGGMVFPKVEINEIKKQEGRDLERFDVEFDIPEHFTAEFPPPIFLTTRPDLGDVSQGQLVTRKNFFELFNGILNPKQLEGLRLLTTPFAQQQFNETDDRRSKEASEGVACLDCHANGHTNGAFHLVGDSRPQSHRRRIDTPTLRGVNMQRLFGSQRALRSVEDFTEFEQRAAYFDGDPVTATKKGLNILDRGHQVHDMAEFQELLDFPPAPKLRVIDQKLDPSLATQEELRGQEVFFGKGQCATCHSGPIYSDNFMHDLKVDRFYKPMLINGRLTAAEGPVKTFPLRGIKDSPPYLHDGRLLTLEDTVEFFNLVLELKLSDLEKSDLVAFLRVL